MKLVYKDKRNNQRTESLNDEFYSLELGDKMIRDLQFIEESIGLVVFSIPESSMLHFNPPIKEKIEIMIKRDDEAYLYGKWFVEMVRVDQGRIIYRAFKPRVQELRYFRNVLSPEIFFNPSRYKIFDLETTAGAEEIAGLLSEIKDCPVAVKVKLLIDAVEYSTRLSFEDYSKNLAHLTLEFDKDCAGIESNSNAIVSFWFLNVGYIFSSTVIEIDHDFNLIDIKIPSKIIAFTYRLFRRTKLNLESSLFDSHHKKIDDCRIQYLTPVGGQFSISQELNLEGIFHLTIHQHDLSLPIKVIANQEGTLRFKFIRDANIRKSLMRLIQLINRQYHYRQPDNYQDFFKYYQEIGWKGNGLYTEPDWLEKSKEIWQILDHTFPGNMVSYKEDGEIISTVGTLPFSSSMMYFHSGSMKKSLSAAIKFGELTQLQNNWLALEPGIKFFFVSVRVNSRFTTRMFSNFQKSPQPHYYKQVYNKWITKEPHSIKESLSVKFHLEEISFAKAQKEESLMRLFHPSNIRLKDIQRNRFYYIKNEEQERIALIFDPNFPNFLVASNNIKYPWIFLLNKDEKAINEIYNFLIHEPTFKGNDFNFVSMQGKEFPPNVKKTEMDLIQQNGYWLIVPKEDCGPLNHSISKSSYYLIRKYGEEGIKYIKDVI